MEVVGRDATTVVGFEVVASFQELAMAVPAAWSRLFDRRSELPGSTGSFAEASRHLGEGRYREVVGAVVAGPVPVPDGMTLTTLPAGDYVHHRHEGPVETIANGFQVIYDWAAGRGLRLGELKLDVGYRADGRDRPHDLFIDLCP